MVEAGTHKRRVPRYIGVSLACILINNGLLILLDASGVHYFFSVLISAAVMIPLSFVLQSRFAFATVSAWSSFFRYAAVLIVNTPLAWLILWLIHGQARLPMFCAAPLMTGLLFIWNYLAGGWALSTRPARSTWKQAS